MKEKVQETSKFWDDVRKSALPKDSPNWMRAGIRLNPEVFETYSGKKEEKK